MDKDDFEKLLTGCRDAVERYVYFKAPTKADGDDILQEVFLAAYRYLPVLNDQTRFKPWLLKIAANKCNDFYRNYARQWEVLYDEPAELVTEQSLYGITVRDIVRDTLDILPDRDRQLLNMFYFLHMRQDEMAECLHIPIGTVKSRLHAARNHFKRQYPYPPQWKGETHMKELPQKMPDIVITPSDQQPFSVRCEEMGAHFIIPRLGEACRWAIYDYPARTKSNESHSKAIGKASVHGAEGIEIQCHDTDMEKPGEISESSFVAQLTDTHCRILSETHYRGDVKHIQTFLDADTFIPDWGYGEDNCGYETQIKPQGLIRLEGCQVATPETQLVRDIAGRYGVTVCGKSFDTILVMEIQRRNIGSIMTETYLDANGRTVLWRRYNHDEWAMANYKEKWSQKLPDNRKMWINGELYVHWYDCITDYVLLQ